MDPAHPDPTVVRAVQEARGHAVFVTDALGLVTWMNLGAEILFRAPSGEYLGGPLARIFTPEDVAAGVVAHELEVARARGESDDDRWHLRADGSRFWASGVLYAVRDPGGEVVAYGKILRDRTALKEELETWRNRFDAAREAAARRQLSLATLAHELRTPLAAVVHSAEVLRRTSEDPALDVLIRQVNATRELVHHLLEGLRGDVDKAPRIDRRPLDLRDVVREAVEAVAPIVTSHHHELRVLTGTAPTLVEGDPARLRQVVVNLVENAAKYTPDGGHVWIEVGREGEEAVIRVVDDGQGIPPELVHHVFELFTQVDGAEDGLGLGLALVREITELHGGTVQGVSGGPGQGSTFIVRLPRIGA